MTVEPGGIEPVADTDLGYTAGWNPYAADYTRYLPKTASRRAIGLYAGGGLFLSTTVLMLVGAFAANVLNVYSGALAFLALGIRLPPAWRRAVVALAFGAVGFVPAWLGLADAGHAYENFLMVIAYWIGPWLGVLLADHHLRRGHRNVAGFTAFLVGLVVSVGLFANQALYTAPIPKAVPATGDLTFAAGFVLATGTYLLLRRQRTGEPSRRQP